MLGAERSALILGRTLRHQIGYGIRPQGLAVRVSVVRTGCCRGGQLSNTLPAVRYEWDPAKAAANLEAHRVSFSEASTVLSDAFALTREDPQAAGEQRFVTDYEKNHP